MVKKSDEDRGGDDEAEQARNRRAKNTYKGLYVLGGFGVVSGAVFFIVCLFFLLLLQQIDILSLSHSPIISCE